MALWKFNKNWNKSLRNLLPNTNWQLFTNVASVTSAMNYQGAGTQGNISVSSFTVNSPIPTFYTSNTGQLIPGAIVTFPGGLGNLSFAPMRVVSVNPNVSFTAAVSFGRSSPATSSATTAFPTSVVDYTGGSGYGPDGWLKDNTLIMWADDFPQNSCPGALRVLGLRKTVSTPEFFYSPMLPQDVRRYWGKYIVIGALVYQKLQCGAGTSSLFLNIDGNFTCSPPAVGASYFDPVYGSYEFNQVAAFVPPGSTSILPGLRTEGGIADRYYLGSPTVMEGTSITVDQLGQPFQEKIRANNHFNPLSLLSGAWTFPTTQFVAGSGLYGWSGIDLGAISGGAVGPGIREVDAKIEMQCPAVGTNLMTGSQINGTSLVFGPQVISQVANNRISGQMALSLNDSGCFMMCVDNPGAVFTNITWDLWSVLAA